MRPAGRPDFWIAHLALGWLDTDAARYAGAVNDYSKASELSGGSQQAVAMLGFALAHADRKPQAQALLASLLGRSRHDYVPATGIATIYCGLGDNEQALAWLARLRHPRRAHDLSQGRPPLGFTAQRSTFRSHHAEDALVLEEDRRPFGQRANLRPPLPPGRGGDG